MITMITCYGQCRRAEEICVCVYPLKKEADNFD